MTEGKILVDRGDLWCMVVTHSLFSSPGAASSEETLFVEGCLCLNGREERISR